MSQGNSLLNAPPETVETDCKLQRRDCAIAGAKIYARTVISVLGVWCITFMVLSGWNKVPPMEILQSFAIAGYLVVPPVSLIGALIGFELYRIASGSIDWQPSPWWVWILGVIFLSWLVVPLYFQQLHRKRVLIEAVGSRTSLPVIYLIIYACVGIFQVVVQVAAPSSNYGYIQAFGVLFSVLLADCLLVNHMAQCRDDNRLAPPTTHRFQFTLGTMMAVMLGAGAWITGIVMIFSRY